MHYDILKNISSVNQAKLSGIDVRYTWLTDGLYAYHFWKYEP